MMNTIIFDFDGTLVDTRESIVSTMSKTSLRLGCGKIDSSVVISTIGLPLKESIRRATCIENEEQLDNAVALYRRIYQEDAPHTVKLYPGVRKTLEELFAGKYKLAVATSRGKDSLIQMLEVLGIRHLFLLLKADEDVSAKKPAPDMVLSILSDFDCSPTDAIVIGDTAFDIEMGKRAGVQTCGVTYGNHSREQLVAAGADFTVDSFTEIKTLLPL